MPINLTNGDQSDVAFTVSITDVRDKETLADYTGELAPPSRSASRTG